MRESASRTPSGTSSWSHSIAPGTSASRGSPGRDSGSRSADGSSRHTVVACRSATGRTAGPGHGSRSRCRSRQPPIPAPREPWASRVAERILIVEDEPEFAALLELWMGTSGYEPVLASSGNEALRRFYETHPDLVILDVALHGLDGWQVIERIREFSRVPILMVTARSSEADKVRGLKLGAGDY